MRIDALRIIQYIVLVVYKYSSLTFKLLMYINLITFGLVVEFHFVLNNIKHFWPNKVGAKAFAVFELTTLLFS